MTADRPAPSESWRQSKAYPNVLARIVAEVRDNAPPSGQPFNLHIVYREWSPQAGEKETRVCSKEQFDAEWGPYEPIFRMAWRRFEPGDRYLIPASLRFGTAAGDGASGWVVLPDDPEVYADPEPAESEVTCVACNGTGVDGDDRTGFRVCPACHGRGCGGSQTVGAV